MKEAEKRKVIVKYFSRIEVARSLVNNEQVFKELQAEASTDLAIVMTNIVPALEPEPSQGQLRFASRLAKEFPDTLP
jgi:hypothetical protein